MKRVLFVAVTSLLIVATLAAQDRGPSTPEERATAVRLAHMLESEPLAREAKDARQWFTVWLITVPDITVTLCADLLSSVPRSAKKYSSEISVQPAYSSAAFMIENPERAHDQLAVYQAGLEGALKVYDAIRKQEPKISWPFLDELEQKKERGELPAHVAAAAQKCAANK
jgi:hypothetical protein